MSSVLLTNRKPARIPNDPAPHDSSIHAALKSDASFLRGLREIGRRAQNARRDRVQEVGGADAFQRGTDRVDVREIADRNFDPACAQRGRTVVVRSHVGAHALAHLQQFVDGGASGAARRTAYKNG